MKRVILLESILDQSSTSLSHEEEKIKNELVLVGSNDEESYNNGKNATMAVSKAFEQMMQSKIAEIQSIYEKVKQDAIAEVNSSWSDGNSMDGADYDDSDFVDPYLAPTNQGAHLVSRGTGMW